MTLDEAGTRSNASRSVEFGAVETQLIWRLLRGEDVEEFSISEVSDDQLYGSKHKRHLPEELATEAIRLGFEPYVYQSVLWSCFVYLPSTPLGTYLILEYADSSERDFNRFRGVQLPDDVSQVRSHYLACYGSLGIVFALCLVGLIAYEVIALFVVG